MQYDERVARYQAILQGQVDVAFLPIGSDLDYLVGVPRDVPNFGAVIHPGMWLEGAWLAPNRPPILALPRMTAEFGGLNRLSGVDLRVLGDWDEPAELVRGILKDFGISGKARVAVSRLANAETVVNLQKILPEAVFVSATDLLRPMRAIKSADEIAMMRRAGEITEAAFKDVIPKLKFGMSELDIISEVDYQLKRHGSLGPSFTTSMYNSGPQHPLVFGDREKRWHKPLNAPVALLFDFGGVLDGFCYDFGRTVSFGAPSAEFQKVFDTVMASQRAGIAALKAGSGTCESADAAARQVIIDAGYGPAFRHRLGHGIGMDVHEPPFLTKGDTTVLQEGMMFTVEPSIMQFETYSSRVEDVVVVRNGGGEPLTTGFQSLTVVE